MTTTPTPYMRCVAVTDMLDAPHGFRRRVIVTNNHNSVVVSFYVDPYFDDELEAILKEVFPDD